MGSSRAHASPLMTRSVVYDWDSVCQRLRVCCTPANILPRSTSSASLKWTPCFDNFACTRLEVPLDYANPGIGDTSTAFMKLAAQENPGSANSILFNDGIVTAFIEAMSLRS